MDLFNRNNLNGKKLDELCVDIICTLKFSLKHPCNFNNIKILTKQQIDSYEELIDINNRELSIYLISFIFEKNYGETEQKYPWKLQKKLNNKQDLKNLINELYLIKNSVKMIREVEEHEFINVYEKYQIYLPN